MDTQKELHESEENNGTYEEDIKNEKEEANFKKPKAGRKPSISNKVLNLMEILRRPDFEGVIKCNGEIAAPSSEIFRKVSDAMEVKNRMEPKYIYTIILENRYSVYSDLTSFLNIEPAIKSEKFTDNSTLDSSTSACEFRLNVTEIWPSLQPETTLHHFKQRDRNIRKLRKNTWTHVLFEEIYNFTNIPCALTFDTPNVTESGIFVKVDGSCPECPCSFLGQIIEEPKEGDHITMHCEIKNFDESVVHKKKRPLQGNLRTAVSNQLIDKNLLPSQHRKNEAHRLIKTVGDESPPHLFKGAILGKAKQERLNEQLGLTTSKAIDNLYMLKYDVKYQGAIRNIGLDPVYIYYWFKEQQIIFKKFPKTLYLDGTGSKVRSIKSPNNKLCSHIYLYQALVNVNGKSVPVFQMLSSAQSTVAIMAWLLEFRRIGSLENKKYPFPQEVITDFDKAILGALARAFVQVTSLQHFLSLCFQIIQGSELEIPACVLRLDVGHYTAMIARWKCYPIDQPGVRSMYLRIMCVLRRQDNFAEFEAMAIAILTLALGNTGKEGSLAYEAKTILKLKIKGVKDVLTEDAINNAQKFESLEEYDLTLNEDEYTESNRTSLTQWVQDIYNGVMEKCNNEKVIANEEVNAYRITAFALKLKDLLLYFPLFTEIIRNLRGFGVTNLTSAPVESYFNDLKNRTFKAVGLPVRLDKFVTMHLSDIEKKLKESATGSLIITETGEIEAVLKDSVSTGSRKRKNNDSKEVKEVCGKETQTRSKKQRLPAKKSSIKNSKDENCDFENASNTELNHQHNWRNRNEKIDSIKQTFAAESSIEQSEEDDTLKTDMLSSSEKEMSNLSENFKSVNDETQKTLSDDSDDDVQKHVNNFKNLQEALKSKTKKTGAQYGEFCPEFEPSMKSVTCLPILPNGSRCGNVRERLLITVISNSCAIDSLLQVISMLILNDDFYKQQTENVQSPIFSLARLFIQEKVSAVVYNKRAKILRDSSATVKEILQYDKPRKNSKPSKMSIVKVNAVCNITNLVTNLFEEAPSYTADYACSVCQAQKTDVSILARINLQTIKPSGVKKLEEALYLPFKRNKLCCNKMRDVKAFYGPHLLVTVAIGEKNEVRICDIPSFIEVDKNTKYYIAGLVAYIGSYDPTVPGHYLGYVKVGETWLKYDDFSSSKSPQKVDKNQQVDPHFLYYAKMPPRVTL